MKRTHHWYNISPGRGRHSDTQTEHGFFRNRQRNGGRDHYQEQGVVDPGHDYGELPFPVCSFLRLICNN
ncbi:hypothetical protein AKJ41_05020 [candidate division MSBL1 archaeon SCGC-AAA259O05]|uniref:Uncharacterized protein n=1 Tax=candidate division MSBL1 archaeon SCGC-AAA259O05 TaxID=1698271 RepID=A0A133UZT9_9EURY|nr:hypothetical protein AKJ41_05020 [candidate division MSBL1 archaeon SCGC-AAA259O05]